MASRPITDGPVGKGWRYIAQRLDGEGGGEFIDWDVPLKDVQLDDLVSGHNGLSATITPAVRRLIGPDGLPLLNTEWDTAIWAEKDGEIRGGGIITDIDFDGPELSLEAVDVSGYAIEMPYTDGWFGTEIDPLDVVRHIWQHIQNKPGGDIGLELSDLKTPVKIGVRMTQGEFDPGAGNNPGNVTYYDSSTYKLAWYQDHDLSDNIDKLAADTPFDYHVRHYWDGEVIRHFMDFGYPTLGKKRTGLRFVFGENIHVLPSIERTGTTYATETLALGAGEGRKMVRGSAFRPRGTGLRRVAVVTDSSLRTQKAVNRLAASELKWRTGLDDISEIVVEDTPHAPLGAVQVGDVIKLEGRASDWKAVEFEVRVIQISIRPDEGNRAVYTVQRTDAQTSGSVG